jgi:UDP-N-acetylmuramoylalanine--D-glutamate ligase
VITSKAFEGRDYAVYGLARSGLATIEALVASGARVTCWDRNYDARERALELAGNSDHRARGAFDIADLDEIDLSRFDSLVVTPGLPLNSHTIARRAREAGVEIIGDIELFARARPELPAHKVVGITGTNGKSTTTALVTHVLKTAGVPSTMAGNIGLPILAQDALPPAGVYVLELSSYQIDLTKSLDCDVAVLLNITPDHLDRYPSFAAYIASKIRLLDLQSDRHIEIISRESGPTNAEYEKRFRAEPDRVIAISAENVPDQSHWPTLQGPHNAENAAAAIAVCKALDIGEGETELGLRTYPGLPHRMERVGEKHGVMFVNDSKATNPTATAPALAAFDRIRWILGGRAKSRDLDECKPHFGHVASAYTIGEAADLFEELLKPFFPVKNCQELALAVQAAAEDAAEGDTVLLSPACASFDQFRDFEERGDKFRELVGGL